jgi:hypothetical protein
VSVGETTRSRGGIQAGRKTSYSSTLLRGLRRQQAEQAQLLVGENHLLAPVIVFQVTQARYSRITPQFRFWESEKHRGVMLVHLFLDIRAHAKAQTFGPFLEHARRQTARVLSLLLSTNKRA